MQFFAEGIDPKKEGDPMNLKAKILGFSALGVFLALPAAADVVNVYQIGATSNICGPHTAQDPSGACINGSAAPTWVNIG